MGKKKKNTDLGWNDTSIVDKMFDMGDRNANIAGIDKQNKKGKKSFEY